MKRIDVRQISISQSKFYDGLIEDTPEYEHMFYADGATMVHVFGIPYLTSRYKLPYWRLMIDGKPVGLVLANIDQNFDNIMFWFGITPDSDTLEKLKYLLKYKPEFIKIRRPGNFS